MRTPKHPTAGIRAWPWRFRNNRLLCRMMGFGPVYSTLRALRGGEIGEPSRPWHLF